jgi:AraC-like DNA-binding protein
MATTLTNLRQLRRELHSEPMPAGPGPLDRVRDLVLSLAKDEGHCALLFPDLCVYRFSQPTKFRKAATFGVTLGVALQGVKQIRVDDHHITVDSQRLLVITRERQYESAVLQATPDEPYVGVSLSFSPERVARALITLAEAGGETHREPACAFVTDCDEHIASALERLLLTHNDPLDRKLLAPLAIDEILFRLLRSEAAAAIRSGVGMAADAQRILESMQRIREQHAEKLSVEGLARKAGMSPSHYAHRFRAVARVSPMRYVREVRLDRARNLLLASGARAGEVGLTVGFESPAHFAREFKRRFGVPPSRSAALHG